MRIYTDGEERAVRAERLVREWTRSGLLDKTQEARMLPEFQVGLRRTNPFFRLVLFGFGILIIVASVLLVGVTVEARSDAAIAVICVCGAVASLVVSEALVAGLRLYRFGIEEAAAFAAGTLLAVASGMFGGFDLFRSSESALLAGLIVASIAALAIYLRFGYVYAAAASMACMTAAPFYTSWSPEQRRLASVFLLVLVSALVRSRRRKRSNEYPDDEYNIIQALAWMGVYAFLNLHLSSLLSLESTLGFMGRPPASWFYVLSYAAIWILPAIGLLVALRERDRSLLDVNIILGLVTLATNKPYLGAARQTWDPILLGVFLIGTAIALRRWLSSRDRNGFTAARILLSDKRRLAGVGLVSAALQPVPQTPSHSASDEGFEPGGGRSGGGGASGSFD